MVSHLFAYDHQQRSLLFPHGYFSFLLFHRSSTKILTKSLPSFFLTSINVAQKVKKFKTLTSVKKFSESLTNFFRKSEQNFPSSKEKSFSSKVKFPTSKEENPSSKEVFRRKVLKKEGQHCPPQPLCKYTLFFGKIQICISRHFYKS